MSEFFHSIVEFTIGGGWGEEGPKDGYVPVRIIRGADFPNVQVRDLSALPLRYEPASKASSRRLRDGDIVLETSGGTRDRPTGRTVLVTESLLANEIATIPASFCRLIRVDKSKVVPTFVYYVLQDLYLAGGTWQFQNQSTGISNFQFEVFRHRFSVPSFPLAEQQAIAEVLGALDDKIAANTGLANGAIEYADLAFPQQHQQSTAQKLDELVTVTKGVSYRSADLAGGTTALVTLKSIGRDGRYAPTGLKPYVGPFKAEQVITPDEIVVAQTDLTQAADVVGRAVRVPKSAEFQTLVASLDLAIVRPKSSVDRTYLLGLLRQRSFHEHCRSNATGTTVLHLRKGAIESFVTTLADRLTQDRYAALANPLFRMADSLAAENRTLAELRDTLLPELMSGRLRVKDAEKNIEEVL